MTVKFGVRFIVLSYTMPFENDGAITGGAIDGADVASDINSAVAVRWNLESRKGQVDVVKIRDGQIQSRTLARVQRNWRLQFCPQDPHLNNIAIYKYTHKRKLSRAKQNKNKNLYC